MFWTIETVRGGFQGSKAKKTIGGMIEFYAARDEQPDNILSICGLGKKEKFLDSSMVAKIQDHIEEEVLHLRKLVREEAEGLRQIEREFRNEKSL